MQCTTRNLALLALALACAGCGGPADEGGTTPPTIVYVDPTAVGLDNGTSWADAYPMLSTALLNAPAGAQVWIAAGTYKRTTGGDRTLSFAVERKLALYGGFLGSETDIADRDLANNRTVLSGDIGIAANASDNTHTVLAITAADVVLDGLEIADAAGSTTVRGAGVDVAVGATGLTVRNLVVRDCANAKSTSFGAGLVLGGGVGATFRDCVFAANAVTDGDGGGLWLGPGCSASLVNCVFVGNRALAGSGAAILASSSHLSLLNTTVFDCDNANDGPVHVVTATAKTVSVRNCLFDGNSGSAAAGSVSMSGPIVSYTIAYNRLDGTNAWSLASGPNILTAVSYVPAADADGADNLYGTTDDGLRLAPASAGVGAGLTGSDVPTSDLSGLPRNTFVDLGAYDQPSGG